MSNSDIVDFWTKFTNSYYEWKSELTAQINEVLITTDGDNIALTGGILGNGDINIFDTNNNISSGHGAIINGETLCEVEMAPLAGFSPSTPQLGQNFNEFCKLQKLTFCAYCQPMCKIHQNCITDSVIVICHDISESHGASWSLVQTCCEKCGNFQCDFPILRYATDCPPLAGGAIIPPTESSKSSISNTPSEENDHLLQILMPLVIVTILSILALAAFCFHKKRKSIKYKPLCQFEILSESEVSAEAEDRTEISITELWDQIKNKNDAKDSMKMKPRKNNAPLACVLRSSETSDSEV